MQTILIIDDDETIGDLEQEVLTRAGYRTLRAYAGTEALLLLKEHQPDLILLDLMLPGLSGEALLPKLAGIPVIVVSADTPDCTKRSLRQHRPGRLDHVHPPGRDVRLCRPERCGENDAHPPNLRPAGPDELARLATHYGFLDAGRMIREMSAEALRRSAASASASKSATSAPWRVSGPCGAASARLPKTSRKKCKRRRTPSSAFPPATGPYGPRQARSMPSCRPSGVSGHFP